MEETKFSAKVLLFGEHTILRGSKALAIPFPERNCYWSWKEKHQDTTLAAFADYLESTLPNAFNIEDFRIEIHQGLYLQSSIPNGYGLGSSGAVCVAVFHRFAKALGREQLEKSPKTFFGQMESFFHGSSSGTDPLIIYLNENLCLHPNGGYEVLPLDALTDGLQFFLLDTEQQRKTAPFVNLFIEKYDQENSFQKNVDIAWSEPSNEAIDALISNNMPQLWSAFERISRFQYKYLQDWILPSLFPIWGNGLNSNDYLLKICGAGGGGYCLGLTRNWAKTKIELSDFSLIELKV